MTIHRQPTGALLSSSLAPDDDGDSRWGDSVEDFVSELSTALDRQPGFRVNAVKVGHPVIVIDHTEKLRPEK